MPVDPITPNDISERKIAIIPDIVITTWNNIIAIKYSEGYAKVLQKDIVRELASALACQESEIFKKGYLEIEDIYRKAGWTVSYDKPVGWAGENFDAYFEFRKKR